MNALGAARYIERAAALALALGVAVAMSAQAPVGHATETPAAHPTSASGGCIGVIWAILVALGRAVFLHPERRENRSSAMDTEPAITPDVEDASEAAVRTVTGVGPVRDIALSPDGRYAYVAAASGSDTWTVKVVDTESDAVVKTIEDLADVVPMSLAASPDSSLLYIADRNAAAIRVVDVHEGSPTRNRVVDSLHLEESLPVGDATPAAITLSPSGSRLYALMTDSGSNPAVLILDPESRLLVGTVSGGNSIAMFSAGERVYVCADDRLGHTNVTAGVVILDADTGQELGSFGLNDAPAFIRQPILAGSSGQLYLDIDDLDGRLEVVDTSTLKVVARIGIDASADRELRSIPAAAVLSPDGRCLYVANQGVRLSSDEATEVGWVSVVDTGLNKVIHDIELQCDNPQFIVISPAGDRLVVVNEYGIASIIDVASKSVVGTATLGKPTDQPRVVVVNTARNAVYVGTSGDAGLRVIPL
ncbi:MAG: YncE family protein [Mycobacterium sp.]|uniref:YncE family protein n=1 Tax=Mycobacterium sp. TaxID=1785 RepID=UPI00389A4065